MRTRCADPSNKYYGAKGVTVCAEWNDYTAFRDWAQANGYRDDLSIERIDSNGNYEPSNCTWATAKEQSSNRDYTNKNNDGILWLDIARENGISRAAFRTRIFDGWSFEEASSHPINTPRVPRPRNSSGQFI